MIPSETVNDCTAVSNYAPKSAGGSSGSRSPARRCAGTSGQGDMAAEGDKPAAGGSPAPIHNREEQGCIIAPYAKSRQRFCMKAIAWTAA